MKKVWIVAFIATTGFVLVGSSHEAVAAASTYGAEAMCGDKECKCGKDGKDHKDCKEGKECKDGKDCKCEHDKKAEPKSVGPVGVPSTTQR